ncbi:MAG TPA: hypothetical protein VID73_08475 [Ktedonobacterales bacterium]|jgi:FtsZ-binding cell division protein ZapB
MVRWEGQRHTHPLPADQRLDDGIVYGARNAARDEELMNVAERSASQGGPASGYPGAPADSQPGAAPANDPLALPSDDPELQRIREILVGPHLRDHERRVRQLERRAGEPHPQVRAQAETIEQLRGELEREREGRQHLRQEVQRERQAREELANLHARALSEMAQRLESAPVGATYSGMAPAELEARLERERALHQHEHTRIETALNAEVATLRALVADAERALVAMQAERQHLAGLLAELGLHLIRHAASPAAAQGAQATEQLSAGVPRLGPGRNA